MEPKNKSLMYVLSTKHQVRKVRSLMVDLDKVGVSARDVVECTVSSWMMSNTFFDTHNLGYISPRDAISTNVIDLLNLRDDPLENDAPTNHHWSASGSEYYQHVCNLCHEIYIDMALQIDSVIKELGMVEIDISKWTCDDIILRVTEF